MIHILKYHCYSLSDRRKQKKHLFLSYSSNPIAQIQILIHKEKGGGLGGRTKEMKRLQNQLYMQQADKQILRTGKQR